MSTLINILEKNHSNDLSNAMLPVRLQPYEAMDGYTLNKTCYAVLDTKNKRSIALHGKDYNLIPYEKILKGLSEAMQNYGIKLNNVKVTFNVAGNLNYMRLRIIFNDIVYGLKYNEHDKLNLAIEVISSYDASIIFKLRTMFFRLICSNGMAEIKPIASSLKKHTTGLNFMNQFKLLESFNNQVNLLKDQFEVLTRIPLQSNEVQQLFKGFAKSDNKIHLLNDLMHRDLNQLNKSIKDVTLFDVYNAVTNYSSHNQRAVAVGKRGSDQYKIEASTMDAVKSTASREVEIEKFLRSKLFLTFYNRKALSTN